MRECEQGRTCGYTALVLYAFSKAIVDSESLILGGRLFYMTLPLYIYIGALVNNHKSRRKPEPTLLLTQGGSLTSPHNIGLG